MSVRSLGAESLTMDEPTMDRAVGDHEERFARFVALHRERSLRLAWRLVGGDAAAAEDVVQDALVSAYRALDGFRGEASLDTWFYRILVRRATSHLRWRGVRRRFASDEDPDGVVAAEAPRSDPWLRRQIRQALDALPHGQRSAFVLVHLEGFSVREAAAILGRAEGTVKSHLHRGLTKLRAQLAALDDGRSAGPEGDDDEA